MPTSSVPTSSGVTGITTTTAPPALSALTTQFRQGTECASIWGMITTVQRTNSEDTTLTILTSNANDPHFASCQPSGWDAGSDRFSFSPAVCPSSWTYFDMAGFVFTHMYEFPVTTMTAQCVRSFSAGETTIVETISGSLNSARSFTEGIQVHQPWHISWSPSDDLPFPLPELTSDKLVPTWVPGETIPPGKYDYNNYPTGSDMGLGLHDKFFAFMVIGLPVIAAVFICGCIFCCVRGRRVERRHKKLALQRQREEAQEHVHQLEDLSYEQLDHQRTSPNREENQETGQQVEQQRQGDCQDPTHN
ncbi:hypothetical protein FQN54_000161 [Arachnomyces sp. PD_36]|nr:hypothetical protein FQN54_000161 [Arachnomyces sp. PD_36]